MSRESAMPTAPSPAMQIFAYLRGLKTNLFEVKNLAITKRQKKHMIKIRLISNLYVHQQREIFCSNLNIICNFINFDPPISIYAKTFSGNEIKRNKLVAIMKFLQAND